MPNITKRFVDTLTAPVSKETFCWDDKLVGFGIRQKPRGTPSFLIQYRNQDGRTRRLSLGKVGTLSPDEARALAREKLAEVCKGNDPSAERQQRRKAMTVAELCDLYIADAVHRLKPSTMKSDRCRIDSHVKPLLGSRTVASLTPEDIERFQRDVALGKSARAKNQAIGSAVKGGRGTAGRTFGMLRTILEWAKRMRIIPSNPAREVRKFADGKRTRYLSAKEIAALGREITNAYNDGVNPTALAAIVVLLLTGCRRNEILALPPAWADLNARCLRLGDTKTGAQIRPLGKAAIEWLRTQTPRATAEWMFPSWHGGRHFIGLRKVFNRLTERAGIEGACLHTLRHTFASVAAEIGFSELTIAGMIGHSVSGITARYSHLPDSALLAAADTVSTRIADALRGKVWGEVIDMLPVRLIAAESDCQMLPAMV